MKRCLCVLVLCLAGCGSVPEAYVSGVESAWGAIGPEYRAYFQADPNLSEEQKGTRLRTCQLLEQVLRDARASLGGTVTP